MSNRVTLQSRKFDGDADGPHLLISGGVHGDEFEPMQAVRRLIATFDQPDACTGMTGRLTLVPVVNEAAFLRGHRMADDGLDLARVCPGKADGSVTEQTAHELSRLITAADLYIDLHTGGTELSVWPMAGYSLHSNPEIRETQRRMARAFNLPVVWGTAGDLDGRSLSVARDANVPAIYAEYLGGARCDTTGVDAYYEGCLNVMAEFGMIDRAQPASRIEHVVEDPRSGSGHLQVCNPSPMDGYFDAAVALGDPIAIGDLLGTVCDPLGGESQEIRAEQAGYLLVLRTFPRVRKGESVGVVMETI